MYKIQTFNNISAVGLDVFPRDLYEVASEIQHPDAVLLRSHNMHKMTVPKTLMAVVRAGAGVNNIPVEKLSARGIPVFNTPGANANAVKELVITGMLLAVRNICPAWQFTQILTGDNAALSEQVEAGKKQFVGFELAGRTLGIVGLGAIGVLVANAAIALEMNVVAYDPQITVQRAWQLSSTVKQARSVDEVLVKADIVTFHVPLLDATRNMLNATRLNIMHDDAVVINLARQGIVDDAAVTEALNAGKLHAYVTDFPSAELIAHPQVIALPHLGASTKEASENCAKMAAQQLRDYLEQGNIRNSVNFPETMMPRNGEGQRLAIANANVPNMVGQISTHLADAKLNILDMLNKSRGDLAYTLIDVDAEVPEKIIEEITKIKGVLSVRVV